MTTMTTMNISNRLVDLARKVALEVEGVKKVIDSISRPTT